MQTRKILEFFRHYWCEIFKFFCMDKTLLAHRCKMDAKFALQVYIMPSGHLCPRTTTHFVVGHIHLQGQIWLLDIYIYIYTHQNMLWCGWIMLLQTDISSKFATQVGKNERTHESMKTFGIFLTDALNCWKVIK